METTGIKDHSLIAYKTLYWAQVVASKDKDMLDCSNDQKKRRRAVWE